MATGEEDERRDDEADALSKKVEAWGKELPENEQVLLQLLLARAEGVMPEDVTGIELPASIGDSAARALRALRGREIEFDPRRSSVWVRMGEIWMRRAE